MSVFAFPEGMRKALYTTNAVVSLHMSLRKIIKSRASFPSEEAAITLLYLALDKQSKKRETVQVWKQMLNHLGIGCGRPGCGSRGGRTEIAQTPPAGWTSLMFACDGTTKSKLTRRLYTVSPATSVLDFERLAGPPVPAPPIP